MALHKKHPELEFEKKNQDLKRLPKYARIEKRPVPHPPAASPYVGSHVAKVVYVSTNTPFMSAAKRVQRLLREAEKRATSKISLQDKHKSEKQRLEQFKDGTASLQKEEVFIKATGRAIDKAMNVGKWFDAKEEYMTRVKTGSVLVVDDILEDEAMKEKLSREKEKSEQNPAVDQNANREATSLPDESEKKNSLSATRKPASKSKKKRPMLDDGDELPESRTRWVKTVEIAVTLK